MRAFGDDFQPEVTHLLSTGWTYNQIREHIKAKYDISVSQRTLTRRKEDWGLILQAADHAAQIEDHIHTYFEHGLTYSQIHQPWLRPIKKNLGT